MNVADAVHQVRERIVRVAQAAGRDPRSVRLVAVSKRQPIERVLQALEAGVVDLGESTAQGLKATVAALTTTAWQPRWHFIGALQRNKLNVVLPTCVMLHSVDRSSLAEAIAGRSAALREESPAGVEPAPRVDVLVQVNVGHEPQKAGVVPGQAVEFARSVARLPGVRLRGLMAIPPADDHPHKYFDELARLRDQLRATYEGRDACELSMGMSDDFEVAIRCGSTILRVGTGIFGVRQASL